MAEPDLGRIKSNVAKMVAQGAPEADIDAYIAGEGTTIAAIRDAKQSGFTLGGALKAAGSGLVEGVSGLIGLPGTARRLVSAGVDKVLGPLPPDGQKAFEEAAPVAPEDVKSVIETVTGPTDYAPKNTTEKYIKSVSSMAPGIVAGPGGVVRRAVEQVALPGVASQAAGDTVEGTAAEPYVRAAAAVLAPIAAGRIVTPLSTAPTRAAAVQNLRTEGITVSAGQSTGSKFLRKAEEELGGSTTQALAERQAEQFTAAVARRFGTNLNPQTPRLTQEVVDDAFTRIGGDFNRLSANNVLIHDGQLTTDVSRAVRDYNDLVPPSLRSPLVERIEQAVNHQTGGVLMNGEQYQSLRSRLGALARNARQNPDQARAVYALQNSLDDAMERSIQHLNPNSLGEWQQARTEYRNLLVADRALAKTSESASAGLVTPQALSEAIKAVEGRSALTRGRGDLSVLARNGAEVMAPLANSNTASRSRIHQMLAVPGALLGGFGAHGLGPEAALGAAVTGAAVPRIAGEGLIRGRRYIGNTVLNERQTAPANLLRALGSQDRTLQ